MQIIDNLITAAPVLLIMFYFLIGLIVAGILTVPVVAFLERKGWLDL